MSCHVQNKWERQPSQLVAKMIRNNQDLPGLTVDYYGRYMLKKGHDASQLNSSSCQDFSDAIAKPNKQSASGKKFGTSHSILYNGEKWETYNDDEYMECLPTLNVSKKSARPSMNRLEACNSPNHLRLNRSADTVTQGTYEGSTRQYLRPYNFKIQASSDSRIQQLPVSPTPTLSDTCNRVHSFSWDHQEVTPERGPNLIHLQSATDVQSCCSDADEVRCRYCFGGALGWIVKERLISPCWCCGSLAHVHRSCLEKWLTRKKQTHCDLCKYEFITKMKYKPLGEIQFVRMGSEDIFLLIITILVYITFIFQFLAAAYLGLVAEHIPASVLAVSMTGLGLGLFWFLIGCIALTVVTYTSEYWASWRRMNKMISLITNSMESSRKNQRTEEEHGRHCNETET